MSNTKLFLGLLLSICFSVSALAQDAVQVENKAKTKQVQREKKNAAKKAERRKQKMVASFSKNYSAIELTEDQTAKLNELIAENYDTLSGFQTELEAVLDQETRKKRTTAMKAARKDGKNWAEATRIANEEVGLSEEDAETLKKLSKKRGEKMAQIKKTFSENLTDQQKEALAKASPQKRKAEKMKDGEN